MADLNKPAFYPRVGNIKARNFTPARPAPFVEDPRAMELPVPADLSVPTKANLDMSRRIAEREANLRQQAEADRSPLEKVAGALEAVRFMGSALTQSINSMPTRMVHGDEAAEKFMQERIYKPTQSTAYEYAQDIGDFLEKLETQYKLPPIATGEVLGFAPLIQAGVADAARKGTGAAVRGGMALEKAIDPMVTGALERGGLPRDLLTGLAQGTQSNVIKPTGGNWLSGDVEGALNRLKRGVVDEDAARRLMGDEFVNERMANSVDQALNKWVDSNLTNYVKKQMATPEDPVRKLAEEGITHLPDNTPMPRNMSSVWDRRESAGFPKAEGTSREAQVWEAVSDNPIRFGTTGEIQNIGKGEPWMEKVDPFTRVHSIAGLQYEDMARDLGFDHILDVLREDITAGRIRPEQLNKVSMEQAVRRTHEYDQELAKKMAEARLTARADLPVFKEYPEGYRWLELNKPGSFASESEAMGHSVRGYEPPKGHPEWVEGSGEMGSLGYGHGGWEGIKSGRAKVYSLIDSKGQPHVTIETKAPDIRTNYDELQPLQRQADLEADAQNFQTFAERDKFVDKRYQELKAQLMAGKKPEGDYTITQIKGKGNAKPKEDYLPYVQDFVRGGNWADVGDFHNTGLAKLQENSDLAKWLQEKQIELPKYPTKQELNRHEADFLLEKLGPKDFDELGLGFLKGEEGMKRGGVAISNNPDTMMLELGNQKMKNGVPAYGAGKAVIKMGLEALPRAVPKTKAEIEAIAQRIAPQMLGDFVRGEKGTQSVAGKTQKQFAKEKEMVHDIRPTGDERPLPKTVDIEKLKDQVMIGIPGDPTISGQTVHSIAGVPLESPSPQHGGPLYGLGRDDAFWASGLGAANRVQNLAREAGEQYDKPVLGKYIMMGPESINYAQHYADANLSAIDPSKMTKGQIESFNNLVREGYPYVKNKERYQRVFPAFPGIENPSEAYLHFSIDPELRKHFNALMQMPTVTEKHGLPSGIDVRHAITEPDLRDLETGVTGKSIGRLRPEVTKLGLSEHPTYSHDIPGEFLGSSKYPIPYELSFPDTVKAIRENPKQAPHEFGSLKMVGPRQVIDQQMIDEIKQYEEAIKKLTGKKKGGTVHKAEGGAITGDDLIIEERPL